MPDKLVINNALRAAPTIFAIYNKFTQTDPKSYEYHQIYYPLLFLPVDVCYFLFICSFDPKKKNFHRLKTAYQFTNGSNTIKTDVYCP